MTKREVVQQPEFEYEDDAPEIRIGTWYWVREGECEKQEDEEDDLCCVMHIGSNYVLLQSVYGRSYRIHFDEFLERCSLENEHIKHISETQEQVRTDVRMKLKEIEDLTRRLGVSPNYLIGHQNQVENALVPVSSSGDVEDYKHALVKAKEETLPRLYKELKDLHEELATWMQADLLPLEAQAKKYKSSVGLVEERIFHVELYAGLVEEAKLVRKGEPAPMSETIRLMQRRHYMDEECLLDYRAGGMDFKKIKDFDTWLSKRKNFERIFPFSRCVVVFRVRRNRKDYEVTSLSDFIRFSGFAERNESTFLYIRNGERLYRIETGIDFGRKLFPNVREFDHKEPIWANAGFSGVQIVRESERKEVLRKYREEKRKHEEWCRKYEGQTLREGVPTRCTVITLQGRRGEKRKYVDSDSPYFWGARDSTAQDYERMKPFNKENVYYDDIKDYIDGQVKEYNRIILILQGLLDRSEVFHPHPPKKLWRQRDFDDCIELIYDQDRAIPDGDKPDFEAYRARLNESIDVGTHTVGQDIYWKEMQRQKAREKEKSPYALSYGNPGPDRVDQVIKHMPRAKKSVFEWERERLTWDPYGNHPEGPIRCTVTVPDKELLNVDAYQQGDFEIFYQDPRTRAEYLQWAPLLLTAEDFKAGKGRKKDE